MSRQPEPRAHPTNMFLGIAFTEALALSVSCLPSCSRARSDPRRIRMRTLTVGPASPRLVRPVEHGLGGHGRAGSSFPRLRRVDRAGEVNRRGLQQRNRTSPTRPHGPEPDYPLHHRPGVGLCCLHYSCCWPCWKLALPSLRSALNALSQRISDDLGKQLAERLRSCCSPTSAEVAESKSRWQPASGGRPSHPPPLLTRPAPAGPRPRSPRCVSGPPTTSRPPRPRPSPVLDRRGPTVGPPRSSSSATSTATPRWR